jgi:hypothetical protein
LKRVFIQLCSHGFYVRIYTLCGGEIAQMLAVVWVSPSVAVKDVPGAERSNFLGSICCVSSFSNSPEKTQ